MQKVFFALFKSLAVLVQFLKKITENQNVSSRPFCFRKMIDQIFFVVIKPGFEPAPFPSLFVALKETRANGSSVYR